MLTPIRWVDDHLELLDQRHLPEKEVWNRYDRHQDVSRAITQMVVRGAPAIGVTAGYAMALAAQNAQVDADEKTVRGNIPGWAQAQMNHLLEAAKELESSRPTAANLMWAVRRQLQVASEHLEAEDPDIAARLMEEAIVIHQEDIDHNRRLGRHGAIILEDGDRVLTHCNAGALATGGYGTALGVVRGAIEAGLNIEVFAPETRPYLQGARLTAWELIQDGIPVTLLVDGAAADLMQRGEVDAVVVGADCIAANGDVANKIGTYALALAAREHRIPFYVAAPTSTVDLTIPNGTAIPIEERDAEEITHFRGQRIAPEMARALNYAFDVTPASLVSAILTERGIIEPPSRRALKDLLTER